MKCPKCGYEKPKEVLKESDMNKILRNSRNRLKKEIGFGMPEEK